MQSPTMLYKPDGDTEVWGMMLQVTVVDACDVKKYIKDGWVDHPHKIKADEPKQPDGNQTSDGDDK
jgi:hypothetical protein